VTVHAHGQQTPVYSFISSAVSGYCCSRIIAEAKWVPLRLKSRAVYNRFNTVQVSENDIKLLTSLISKKHDTWFSRVFFIISFNGHCFSPVPHDKVTSIASCKALHWECLCVAPSQEMFYSFQWSTPVISEQYYCICKSHLLKVLYNKMAYRNNFNKANVFHSWNLKLDFEVCNGHFYCLFVLRDCTCVGCNKK